MYLFKETALINYLSCASLVRDSYQANNHAIDSDLRKISFVVQNNQKDKDAYYR